MLLLTLLVAQPAAADEMIEVSCTQPFSEAMMHLQSSITGAGYSVSRVQHVDMGLTAAGYATDKYRLVFFGKAKDILWAREKMPELLTLLPLKFIVYQDGENASVVTLDPATFAGIYPDPAAEHVFQRWSTDVRAIVEGVLACTE